MHNHHHGENPYRPIEAEVIEVITETPTIKTIRMKPKEPIEFAAGQFIEMTVPGIGEAPFTPSSRPSNKEYLEVTIMRVGTVTEKIHQLKKGDIVGVRGPLGTGYPIDSFKDKEIVVVGGGCGFAPLRSLMYALFDRSKEFKKLYFRGGCKTSKEMVYRSETDEWAKRKDLNLKLTIDKPADDWKGPVGLVTTILEDISVDVNTSIAVVCGPPIMMKFATKKLLEMGFKDHNILLSMEGNMSCGIGKCGHCRIGTYYSCKDGPVFNYSKIKDFPSIWEG
ncbi:MAG: oxidoreductase [Elusimicrobia bacterium]|nr:oxidoreductase [Elusimicrobiota bacterium]MBD3411776.1 oxidoreductase [Elusimicrobiota bacterium]